MPNGMIDGNVLASLIVLIAAGMFAIWRDVGGLKVQTLLLDQKVDLLWRAKEKGDDLPHMERSRRPRRR